MRVPSAVRATGTVLGDAVSGIRGSVSEEQVVRADAWWIVAVVQDPGPIRDWSVG
jgi:hypothetical protein